MGKARNTTGKGYFAVKGSEPLAKNAVAVRLPESMDKELRLLAGDHLSEWLRGVIAEKLEQERQKSLA
ncbi:MAG: hypothetical protein JO235_07495 [Chroococcidiopsidaceae cyanobacterium CP_BM_RX_35]|nr:hypothetical protein [Chroococcidiopsidaceae cyanobacterium CP_BM_RX_35]